MVLMIAILIQIVLLALKLYSNTRVVNWSWIQVSLPMFFIFGHSILSPLLMMIL